MYNKLYVGYIDTGSMFSKNIDIFEGSINMAASM
jgi:hypothetical protein